jgi:hypothetical protein
VIQEEHNIFQIAVLYWSIDQIMEAVREGMGVIEIERMYSYGRRVQVVFPHAGAAAAVALLRYQ